jgi:hypothetical protein
MHNQISDAASLWDSSQIPQLKNDRGAVWIIFNHGWLGWARMLVHEWRLPYRYPMLTNDEQLNEIIIGAAMKLPFSSISNMPGFRSNASPTKTSYPLHPCLSGAFRG